ncbi:hypothetical protein [Ferruginibacter profundus]
MYKKTLSKNLLALCIAITAVLGSCSVSNEARGIKKNINGNWVLQTITTEGITGVAKTRIFNEADFGCFIGSEWNFLANNSTGSYTIVDTKKECPAIKRFIRWSVYEPKDLPKEFQFKRLDDKKNPMDDNAGFRLKIAQLDAAQMKLRSEITFEGRPAAIIYNFVKK